MTQVGWLWPCHVAGLPRHQMVATGGGGYGHVMSQACHVTRWWWKVMEALSLVLVVSKKIYKINLLVKQNKKKWKKKKKHTKAQMTCRTCRLGWWDNGHAVLWSCHVTGLPCQSKINSLVKWNKKKWNKNIPKPKWCVWRIVWADEMMDSGGGSVVVAMGGGGGDTGWWWWC